MGPALLVGVGDHALGQLLQRVALDPGFGIDVAVGVVDGDVGEVLPGIVVLLPVRGHDGEELGGRGLGEIDFGQVLVGELVQIAHAATPLVHEALAVTVEEQIRHLEAHLRALAVHHLGVRGGAHLGAGPHGGLQARAVAEVDGLMQALRVGGVVVQHLGIAHIVAGSHDDALVGTQQHMSAVLSLADGTRHAAVLHEQLHAGGLEEDLGALGLHGIADDERALLMALVMEVGVGMEEHLMPVAVHRVVVGLRLAAALGRSLGPPGQRLLGVAGPGLYLAQVGAVVALVVDEGQHRLDAGLVRLRQVDGSAHVAGGLHDGQTLQRAHRGARLERGVHGGKPRLARADDHDVVGVLLVELGDLGRLLQKARAHVGRAVLGRCSARVRHLLLGSAARQRAGAGGGDGGEAAELEQVAARNIHSVSHDGSLSLTRDAELL